MIDKIFFTKDNLTPDSNCSLNPPQVLGAYAAEWDFYSAAKRKWQSAPCICKADKNILYCTFSGDNFGGDEQPNNYNVIMKSLDNGKTWETVTIVDHMDSVRMHEPILWKTPDGTIWHFWAQSYDWWDGRGGVWGMKLYDAENNLWTTPRRFCNGVMATPPITLKNGEIMLPVSLWKCWKGQRYAYPNWGTSGVYVSVDNGETFSYVGGTNAKDSTFDENAIVQRKDGSLYMIIRCAKSISYTISKNEGRTWSEPKKLMDHTSSRSYLAKLLSNRYILVTNDDKKERKNLAVFYSTDECKTWKKKLLLDERLQVSYPAGCIDDCGRVYVAYDFNRYSDEEIYYSSFTEKDIQNEKIVEVNSFLKSLIVKGGKGQRCST